MTYFRRQPNWRFPFLIPTLIGFFTALGVTAEAYPSFIGYSYTTCITCHFNSTGNGPLTDYGRSLFSQEIADRPWISKSLNDEDLAALSGFIPGVDLGFVKPSLKYRGLWIDQSPRSSGEQVRWIHMQRDVSLTFLLDKKQRTIVSLSYSLLPMEGDYYGTGNKVSAVLREHYVRFYATRELLVSVGLMDKAFGIKHEDHTAFNRANLGLSYLDQSHQVLLHYFKSDWDIATSLFVGNLMEAGHRQAKGISSIGEYQLFEQNRLGASFLYSQSDDKDRTIIAVHDRWGLPKAHGSAVMAEIGLSQLNDKIQGAKTLGNYVWLQGLINLTRGYNLVSTIERRQDESKFTSPEIQRWTFGFLTFPFQRVETRLTTVQTKTFSPVAGYDDTWAIQGQVHVSL